MTDPDRIPGSQPGTNRLPHQTLVRMATDITDKDTELGGAMAVTFAKKYPRVVNAADYGAVADGATDVIAPVLAALAALGGPGTVQLAPGTYLANNAVPILLTAGQELRCVGGYASIIRRAAGSFGIIRTLGTGITSLTTLTANAAAGDYSVTVASSAGVVVGEYLQVKSTQVWGSGSTNKQGELVLVAAVPDSTHITLTAPLKDSYTTANSGSVRRMNMIPDVAISGLHFSSENPTTDTASLVNFSNTVRLNVSNVVVQDNAGPGLAINDSVEFRVDGIYARNLVDDEANNKFGYGIVVGNCSENGVITNVNATNVRHAFTTVGDPTGNSAGVPRNILVSNGVCYGTPTTAGWDTHREGSNITLTDLTAVGCAIGFQVRSDQTTLNNPVAERCNNGILLTGGCLAASVLNPLIIDTRVKSGVYISGNALVIKGPNTPTDILVKGGLIDSSDNAPIKIDRPSSGATGVDPVNVRIVDVTMLDGGRQSGASGQGAIWIEDMVDITTLLVTGCVIGNRTAAGKLKHLIRKSGAGTADAVALRAEAFGLIAHGQVFDGFNPTVQRGIAEIDSVTAPVVGRGVRKATTLWYGPQSTGTTALPSAGQLALAPLDIDRPCNVTALAAEVSTVGSAGAVVRLGMYADDGSGLFPGKLIVDAGTIDGTSATTQTITLGAAIKLTPGRYWVGAVNQGAPTTGATMRACSIAGAHVMPTATASINAFNAGAAQNGVTAALPSTFTTTYGVSAAPPRVQVALS